jgi:hypothetical protein
VAVMTGLILAISTYILISFMLKHGSRKVGELTVVTFSACALLHLLVFVSAVCFGYSLGGAM